MAGFVRRFRFVPPLSQILEIEGAVIVDLTPPAPITGAGTGAVLVVGEFEDGPFGDQPLNEDGTQGIQEAFGAQDLRARWGGFGYTYAGTPSQNPSARVGEGELWNGNGFLKLYGMRAGRLIIGRVDTSVGEVSFSPLACVTSDRSIPTALSVGDDLTVTTDQGGPASSDAVAAVAAQVTGTGGTFPTGFSGGETIRIETNFRSENIVFSAADSLLADVVAKINSVMGFTIAADDGLGELELTNTEFLGTDSYITLTDVTPGTLATLGHTAGTTNGTGNVANVAQVTNAEVAAIVNGSAALTGIGVVASVTPDGQLRLCSNTAGGAGTIQLTTTPMSTALELPETASAVTAVPTADGTIPAGTRVTDGATTYVTMQTLDVPEGEVGPYTVKVRPALDDGTAAGAGVGTVTTVTDQPTFASLTVSNPSALTAALTDAQKDARYARVLSQSLSQDTPAREANYLLLARRTDGLVYAGRTNAIDAEAKGLFGRKFVTGSKLGTSPTNAIAEVANFRSDRVFYTALGLRVTVPEIAERGTAGGLGFTADGTITVRPDGPLTAANATLPPEENPGQNLNGLLSRFFEVDTFGNVVNIDTYKAFKAAGISAPRLDRQSGMVFQSGVTSSLTPGLTTQARRKMADFIQDSLAVFLPPFAKKLNRQTQRDAIRGAVEDFLSGLLSEDAPELQRIAAYSVDDGPNAGNTDTSLAQGVYYLLTRVRTLSSLDDIVAVTEVGENVVITSDAA